MSKYTTGEIAKLCGVTVRTVQYYDTRGILIPSELTDGGRRLYSEADVSRLKIICFLREIGLPITAISQLLSEEDPGSVISILLDQQKNVLEEEIGERQMKLDKLETLQQGLKDIKNFSMEDIGDIANTMENNKKLKKIRWIMLLTGLPVTLFEIASIIIWIKTGVWWPFVLYWVIAIPWGILIFRYYFTHVSYICPQCHKVFRPTFRETFWAPHTPSTRKLTCTKCGHHGFCVETYGGGDSGQ